MKMMTQKRDDTSRMAAWNVAGLPPAQGLYDPRNEHDACGIGFIANIHNRKTHKIVQDGLKILENLEHRGAVRADPKAGDGAGILIQMPDAFFRKEAEKLGIILPTEGHYAVGMIFMPRAGSDRSRTISLSDKLVTEEGRTVLGWRDVPVDNSDHGESVTPSEPHHMQVFVARAATCVDQHAFQRKLLVIRKRI